MLSVTVSSKMMFSTMLTQSYSCLVKFKKNKNKKNGAKRSDNVLIYLSGQ